MSSYGKGLGREAHFDARNIDYMIADHFDQSSLIARDVTTLITRGSVNTSDAQDAAQQEMEKYHWRHAWVGDQGTEPTCTGFAATKLWVNGPITHKATPHTDYDRLATELYQLARQIDQSEGRNYSGGATMLALAKALQRSGAISNYLWGYSVADLVAALMYGPVLLGIWWRTGMDDPDPKWGTIRYAGARRGGHCICATGIDLDDGMVRLDNTWGRGWGQTGHCYIPLRDLERAIAEDGEVLFVTETKL